MSSSVNNDGENNGMMSQMKEGAMGAAEKFFSLPDRVQNPTARKVARIAFAILIIGLGVLLLGFLNQMTGGGFSFRLPLNPQITSLMPVALSMGVCTLGAKLLVENVSSLFGKKARNTLHKVGAVAMPLLLIGGAMALTMAGFTTGVKPGSMTSWFLVGTMTLGTAGFAILHAANTMVDTTRAKVFTDREIKLEELRQKQKQEEIDRLEEKRAEIEKQRVQKRDECLMRFDVPSDTEEEMPDFHNNAHQDFSSGDFTSYSDSVDDASADD